MRWLCHLVPAVLLALPLSGCWIFHGGGDCAETVVRFCCDDRSGVEVAPASGCPFSCPSGASESSSGCFQPGDDAGVPPDAGGPDAGMTSPLVCPPARGVAACSDPAIAPANQAFTLPVELDACGCCPDTECAVETDNVDGVPTLRLTTTMCPDPCDCDSCLPTIAECAVPPLAPGSYNVVANGAPAYEMRVEVLAPGLVPPPPGCSTFAREDTCRFDERLNSSPRQPDRLCTQRNIQGASIRFEVDCPTCGELLGPCDVRVEPRFTDDLPPGGEIFVDTRSHQSSCDFICPPECVADSMDCRLPELMRGGYYRVWHQGVPVGVYIDGDTDVCFEIEARPPG